MTKTLVLSLLLSLPAAATAAMAQDAVSPDTGSSSSSSAQPLGVVTKPATRRSKPGTPPRPLSRLAFGGGIGFMGINLQAAMEANRYLNIRGTGNVFSYAVNNVKVSGGNGSSGINVSGKLNFASAGVSLDYFPWPNHGLRLSPGMMLYNQNGISASGVASSGSSITVGGVKYYSEGGSNAMTLNARLGLNTHQQAFTMTTGWGNMISRRGGHWSFPFELGAVFTGVPTVGVNITGYGCTNSADTGTSGAGASCVNMATNASAQSNINAQIAKYKNDLNPLKVYPILSFGLAYNFNISGRR
jgi:hypothetical protein